MKLKSEKTLGRFGNTGLDRHRRYRNKWSYLVKTIGRTADNDDNYDASDNSVVCTAPQSVVPQKLLEEAAKRCPFVSIKDRVMEGQPCIDGTRIPVRSVLRTIEMYGSIEGAQRCYPTLTAEHVKDALFFSQVTLGLLSGINKASSVD